MSQLLAYSFLLCAVAVAAIPIIGYIRSKYYYIDTKPIHYWLNKKSKIKKRYRSFRRRNKKYLRVNKIGSFYKYKL